MSWRTILGGFGPNTLSTAAWIICLSASFVQQRVMGLTRCGDYQVGAYILRGVFHSRCSGSSLRLLFVSL